MNQNKIILQGWLNGCEDVFVFYLPIFRKARPDFFRELNDLEREGLNGVNR